MQMGFKESTLKYFDFCQTAIKMVYVFQAEKKEWNKNETEEKGTNQENELK